MLGGDGEAVGQLAVGADRPADVEQHAAAGDPAGDGLDAGDQVALAGDDVAGAAAVPGVAVVEDVAEAVPLGGGLQRHGDHVVGAADAVREALVAALGVVPVSSMVCTGLVRRRQPFCGPFVSKRLRQREARRPRRTSAAPSTRLASSRKFSVPRTSSAPQRPQLEQRLAAAAMAPSGSLRSSGHVGSSVSDSPAVHDRGVTQGRRDADDAAHRSGSIRGRVNLASLDLNLLVSLDALLQQRSVTRAAAQMGLSQPALSASLARLRRHFGDELLTRVGNEYRLTPLAVQLRELRPAGADRGRAGLRRPAGVRPGVLDPGVLPAHQRLQRRRARRHASRPTARRGGPGRAAAAVRQHPRTSSTAPSRSC